MGFSGLWGTVYIAERTTHKILFLLKGDYFDARLFGSRSAVKQIFLKHDLW
jgi:hypothetical protein